MRAAALILLLLSAPALAEPRTCLTDAEVAAINAVLALQHSAVAGLKAENAHLRSETRRIADESSPVVPALVALAVGVLLGGGAVWAATR